LILKNNSNNIDINLEMVSVFSSYFENIYKNNINNEKNQQTSLDLTKYDEEAVISLFKNYHKTEFKIKKELLIQVIDLCNEFNFHQFFTNLKLFIHDIEDKRMLKLVKFYISENIPLEKIENLVHIFGEKDKEDTFIYKLFLVINLAKK
jgi:hypothetical protein